MVVLCVNIYFDNTKLHRWIALFQMKGLIGIGFGANGGCRGEWLEMERFLGVDCIGMAAWSGLMPYPILWLMAYVHAMVSTMSTGFTRGYSR
jgi:hypothetical protein